MRILWLYGPPAVGKSVTAWSLLNVLSARDPAIGYVDIDQLAMTSSFGVDPEGHLLKGRALAAVAGAFAGSGARVLIVSGVLDPGLMPFYAEELSPFAPFFVRLTVGDVELRKRLAARGVNAEEWAGVEAHARGLEVAGWGHPVADTGAGTTADVAQRLLRVVEGMLDEDLASSATRRVVPEAENEGEARALLIGGTTAVGKSTIGWEAFTVGRDDGQPCAFVDLRQLGFMGVDGGVVDHRLQARAVGALWQVFMAHGARLLIMNGPLNTAADLRHYRTALLPTRLEAVRLVAGRSALVERVRARMRGDMARLAGDRLVGRSALGADAVADAALHLQDESVSDPSFLSFDTTLLDAVESARCLLLGI